MREWLVIESGWGRSVFAHDERMPGYIPRDVAEPLLGRSLDGNVWFSRQESDLMRAHPEWRDTEPPHRTRWQRFIAVFRRVKAPAVRAQRATNPRPKPTQEALL